MRRLALFAVFVSITCVFAFGCAPKTEPGSEGTAETSSTNGKLDESTVAVPEANPAMPDTVGKIAPPTDGPVVPVAYRNADGKLVCPVMGVVIESEAAASSHQDYKGKRFYFCCADCPKIFAKDPDIWIKK